jgi:membrane protein implicated in regulation of membrane protease activity
MQPQWVWWILAAVLIALEMTSGTFYLLIFGIAAAAGGLAAWLGLGIIAQLVIAALVAVAGWIALRRWKRAPGTESSVQDLDIGQTVRVLSWSGAAGKVSYRGAEWDARAESDAVDATRPLVIRALRGNLLIVGN